MKIKIWGKGGISMSRLLKHIYIIHGQCPSPITNIYLPQPRATSINVTLFNIYEFLSIKQARAICASIFNIRNITALRVLQCHYKILYYNFKYLNKALLHIYTSRGMLLLFYGVLFVIEPSVFGDNNINVFGDVQGEMVGM